MNYRKKQAIAKWAMRVLAVVLALGMIVPAVIYAFLGIG